MDYRGWNKDLAISIVAFVVALAALVYVYFVK